MTRVVLASALLSASPEVPAQSPQVPTLTVGRPADGHRPTIDGRVDDDVWAKVEPFTDFVQQEPNEGEPATERTEIRFLLDGQNLYVAVV